MIVAHTDTRGSPLVAEAIFAVRQIVILTICCLGFLEPANAVTLLCESELIGRIPGGHRALSVIQTSEVEKIVTKVSRFFPEEFWPNDIQVVFGDSFGAVGNTVELKPNANAQQGTIEELPQSSVMAHEIAHIFFFEFLNNKFESLLDLPSGSLLQIKKLGRLSADLELEILKAQKRAIAEQTHMSESEITLRMIRMLELEKHWIVKGVLPDVQHAIRLNNLKIEKLLEPIEQAAINRRKNLLDIMLMPGSIRVKYDELMADFIAVLVTENYNAIGDFYEGETKVASGRPFAPSTVIEELSLAGNHQYFNPFRVRLGQFMEQSSGFKSAKTLAMVHVLQEVIFDEILWLSENRNVLSVPKEETNAAALAARQGNKLEGGVKFLNDRLEANFVRALGLP